MAISASFIQQLRKKHRMTQEFLASKLSISRPTYIQIERGERELTISEAEKLAALFSIPFTDFSQGKETELEVSITKNKKSPKPAASEIRISIPQERVDKFKQVLLYILKKVGGKPNVGMTVLYKLLYFIDFDYYEKHEEQLMGLTYIKNLYGPTPVLFKKIIDQMVKENSIEEIKSKFYQFPQTKYLIKPVLQPDLTILNGQEKEHIDWELQRLSELSAKELSDLSHKDVPWLSTENSKPIDYEAVFYRTTDTSVRSYNPGDKD